MYLREKNSSDRDAAQMLLATGVVLLLSLLSMAVFSVKVAGITQSNDPSSNGVIQTTEEVTDSIPLLIEARTVTWIDAGTFDSLLMASNVISNIEKIQNYKISCPEEISFRNGWINKNELEKLAQSQIKSGYGKYLKRVLEGL